MTAVIADPGTCLPNFPTATVIAPPDLEKKDRQAWLALRRSGIGGSDIATLLGMNKHQGVLELYLEKRGEYTRPFDAHLDRCARRGKRLESLVAELFAEESGHLVIASPGTLAHTREPWMRVNLDNMVFDPAPAVLECKSRTWRSGKAENWKGEDPPDGPTVQACWGMAVSGWDTGYVAGLVDDDLYWFRIERDQELLDHIITVARRFWFDHVVAGRPPAPDGLDSTQELLAHLWDVKPGSVKIFDPADIDPIKDRKRALLKEIADREREIKKLEGRMKMMLGDAEIAQAPNGDRLFSWIPNGNFAHARLRKELPATAAAYTHQIDAIDVARIQAEDPALYAAYRARVFRDGTAA